MAIESLTDGLFTTESDVYVQRILFKHFSVLKSTCCTSDPNLFYCLMEKVTHLVGYKLETS